MPGPTGKLCPICDSPIEKGAKKCSFCGTDLTIFSSEADSALKEEERAVKESLASPQTAPEQKPAAPAPATPVVEEAQEESEEGAMFECPACGKPVGEDDKVCPHCGAMFVEEESAQFECPACGTLVSADATKCPGCGAIFVEEGAETPAEAESATPVTEPQQPAAVAEPAQTEVPATEVAQVSVSKDPELERIISTAKRIKEEREEASSKADGKKVKRPGLGLFKRAKEEPKKETPEPAPVQTTPAPVTVQPEAAPERQVEAPIAQPAPKAPEPVAPKREFPTDPREQGKELARLVAEVRALLGTATERGIRIDESKDLLDKAINSGRERQFIQALEFITDAEFKLHSRLKEYVDATFASIQEEIVVAGKLGGNPSRADIFLKEATRAAETPDYQAALVFIDKAKTELSPITGKYNEAKDALHKYERLVKDVRAIGIDNEPLKKKLEDAKGHFEKLDFEKTESIVKKSTEEVIAQIPDRMSKEIEKAKQMLVEAKMKAGSGVGIQITILKSSIQYLKEQKYVEALSEMKRFKREMKKILNPQA